MLPSIGQDGKCISCQLHSCEVKTSKMLLGTFKHFLRLKIIHFLYRWTMTCLSTNKLSLFFEAAVCFVVAHTWPVCACVCALFFKGSAVTFSLLLYSYIEYNILFFAGLKCVVISAHWCVFTRLPLLSFNSRLFLCSSFSVDTVAIILYVCGVGMLMASQIRSSICFCEKRVFLLECFITSKGKRNYNLASGYGVLACKFSVYVLKGN